MKINERFAGGRRRGRRRGRDGLGAGLPAAAAPGPCCATGARTCGSGSSCTSPSRPSSCSCSCRGASRSCGGCSARTSSASTRRAAHATSARWPRRLAGATAAGQGGVGYRERTVKLGAFPISIDFAALDELSRTPEVIARAAEIRSELGDPRRLLLGVDRLDYTKGIDVRLRAFEELLDEEQGHGRRHGVPADRDAEPGAGRALHPAARGDRADGRTDQRRPRPASAINRCTTCTSRCPGRS